MQPAKKLIAVGMAGLAIVLVSCLIQAGQCDAQSGFGSSRPAAVIFEPSISFIRQNLRLVTSYVALFRSIFVGSYERPLITSTDGPKTATTIVPPAKVPPMDLPRLQARHL